ncbi:MAG: hypothetical protein QOJ98_1412, partial [Acidobacteriota bacterium]|nr:hypothetical protein [Acidobacteriota bacterium]
ITPGPNSPFVQLDYSTASQTEAPAGSSVYEYFNENNPFDLDFGYIHFTPSPDAGYTVRVSSPPPPVPSLDLTGGPQGQQVSNVAASSVQTTAQNVFAKAEVEVRSSRNVKFKGHTNTDHRGAFKLKKVPPGGITVVLTRNGEIVGVGSAVYDPKAGDPKTFRIDVVAPSSESKPAAQPQE